jgi:hypothetical protein
MHHGPSHWSELQIPRVQTDTDTQNHLRLLQQSAMPATNNNKRAVALSAAGKNVRRITMSTIHLISSLCPICSATHTAGRVDMAGQELKYYCPACNARHYGEPGKRDEGSDGGPYTLYTCGKCGEETFASAWKKKPMDTGEIVCGELESCAACNAKLADGNVAFIEIRDGGFGEADRTGRVVFSKPKGKFKKTLSSRKAIYVEKTVLEKMNG